MNCPKCEHRIGTNIKDDDIDNKYYCAECDIWFKV